MASKKRHWFWNLLIVFTILLCITAFAVHSKNWSKVTPDKLQLLSGFYYKELPFDAIDQIEWVDKIPPMQRLNGFSALNKGNGLYQEFKDSLTDKKVYVYVDNFENRKMSIVYQDSLLLFLNLSDSLETDNLFNLLQEKIVAEATQED